MPDTVQLSLLSLISICMLAVLGVVLWSSHGHYNPALIAIYTCSIAGLLCLSFKHNLYTSVHADNHVNILLLLLSIFFLLLNIVRPGPIYLPNKQWNYYLIGLTFICIVAVFLATYHINKRSCTWLVVAAIGILLVRKYVVIIAVPEPHIDVFSLSKQAVQHLLAFRNPYSAEALYTDIYQGKIWSPPKYPYLPGTLYVHLIGEVLFRDIRAGYLFIEFALISGLVQISRLCAANRTNAFAVIIVYLAFPVQMFFAEQAWTDIILMPLVVWAFIGLLKGNILLTAICLGLAIATKSYIVALMLPFMIFIWKYYGVKHSVTFLTITGVVSILIVAPYLIIDFHGFNSSTNVVGIISSKSGFNNAGVRTNSLNITAFLFNNFGIKLSMLHHNLSIVVAIVFASSAVYFNQFSRHKALLHLSVVLFLLNNVAFLFGKQAYCNYYFFTMIFLLIVLQLRNEKVVTKVAPKIQTAS